jgi:hypothetical protein
VTGAIAGLAQHAGHGGAMSESITTEPSHAAGATAAGWLTASPEHAPALVALLFVPLLVIGALVLLRLLDRYPAAAALGCRMEAAGAWLGPAAVLLVATAAVHAALVPAHISGDPLRAALFGLNAAGFAGLAVAVAAGAWRGPAAAFTALTIAIYACYVASGREDIDLVGAVTKAIELGALAALALSALPARGRRAGAGRTAGALPE